MTIETTTYVRKPFEVEAIQVTEENIQDVKEWCQGVIEADHNQFIRVRVGRALNERQTKAYPGDWVLYAGTGFKVYTSKAFFKTFERQDGISSDAAVQAEKQPPENLLDAGELSEQLDSDKMAKDTPEELMTVEDIPNEPENTEDPDSPPLN